LCDEKAFDRSGIVNVSKERLPLFPIKRSLENISPADILNIFNRINPSRISPEASNFALAILEINKHRLLSLREALL
jgi:hypothetical protein